MFNVVELTKEGINCPVCGRLGHRVKSVTVNSLVVETLKNEISGEGYGVCLDPDCHVVYFDMVSGKLYQGEDLRIPVGFKNGAAPKYACYCNQITEEKVIEAVLNQDARSVAEVNKLTGAMSVCNCVVNNPEGICCSKRIQQIIDSNRN